MNTDEQIKDCPHFWKTDKAGDELLYCSNCRVSVTLYGLLATQKAELLKQVEEKLPNNKTGDDVWLKNIKSFSYENGYNQALQDTRQVFNELREEL